MKKLKSLESKIHSHLTKDINRIQKRCEELMKINILRKHQIKLLNEFLEKLLKEGRITKEELRKYMPKKKESERKLFGNS
ncbi:hypothetical protein J4221_00460 [Candidatus Pacearchaeota archaeon]|nr:hypothetical protein [Candidatus Pacearchaeota archaeon]